MRCYENRSTMMISNCPIEEWGQTSFQFLLQFLYPGSVLSTQSTAKEIAKCGTVRLLVRTLVTRIRGLRISLNGTYQSCAEISASRGNNLLRGQRLLQAWLLVIRIA
jgi:hypothetical protein